MSAQHDPKALATCQARAALLGAALYLITSDAGHAGLIVTWNHLTRSFATLAEVAEWLDYAEGRKS